MILRLAPGARPYDAAQELERQTMAVTNVRAAGTTSQDLLRGYLTWAIQAERMLRNHFTASSVTALVFTHRYWALQTSGTTNWDSTRMLIEAELDEQNEGLRAQKTLLTEAQTRFNWGRLVVVDTSTAIHGTKLWEWNPADDLGTDDERVQVVVPMLVLDELDELKEHTREHTRNRARRTLRWFSENLAGRDHFVAHPGRGADWSHDQRAHPEVHMEVLADEPGHLRLAIADDEIVDRAATIASISGRPVALVTNDFAQAHRARTAGLDVFMVSEPIYDVDIKEAAKQVAREQKQQEAAARRAAQEARRDKGT